MITQDGAHTPPNARVPRPGVTASLHRSGGPRSHVLYDRTWNRWVIYAEAFPDDNGAQYIFIAISTGTDARGPNYKYQVNTRAYAADDFWDFGQMGMDQVYSTFTSKRTVHERRVELPQRPRRPVPPRRGLTTAQRPTAGGAQARPSATGPASMSRASFHSRRSISATFPLWSQET